MKTNKNILLIQHHSPRINFTVPLGLAYLAAIINKGWVAKIIDATAPYSHGGIKYILVKALEYKPRFIGISINTLFAGFAYDLIKELKKFNFTIFAGGPHATLFPHEVLANGADIVVRGEAEHTVEELVRFFGGERPLEDIIGLSFLDKNGRFIDNPDRALENNLDVFPFPAKEAFDIDAYAKSDFELWRYGGIITSRGCIGRCNYCSRVVCGDRYRVRSVDNVLEEIIILHQRYGLCDFYFLDDIFTADKIRTNLLCEKIKGKLDFDFTFSCITRFDRIDRELLRKMKEAGCTAINYGVESANSESLKKINKSVTAEEMVTKIHYTKEAGIDCSINFMWGYPWESDLETQNTISLMKGLAKEVSEIMPGGILIPFPGTELYEQNKERYGLDNWWLDRDRFTGSYRRKSCVALFRHYLFDDQGQFEGGGFFNISRKSLAKIRSAAGFIGWHNLRKRHSWLISSGIFVLCELSRILYYTNRNLGCLFSKFVLFLIGVKNRLVKKDILFSLDKRSQLD